MNERELVRHVLRVHTPRGKQVESFAEIADQLSDRAYWRLAGHIWERTARYFYARLWHRLLTSTRPDRSHFARVPADRHKWEQMPEQLIAYRGHGPENPHGVSFTLDWSGAEKYAALHGARGRVEAHLLRKSACVYYGRRYQEVIYLPRLTLSTHFYRSSPPGSDLSSKSEGLSSVSQISVSRVRSD